MTTASLKQRLAKLEAIHVSKNNQISRAILVGVFDQEDNIVAAASGGNRVARMNVESIASLTARASRELGMQVLFAVYKNGIEAG